MVVVWHFAAVGRGSDVHGVPEEDDTSSTIPSSSSPRTRHMGKVDGLCEIDFLAQYVVNLGLPATGVCFGY